MYISINCLKAILEFDKINLIYFKEKLTLTGFEIEEIQKSKFLQKNDTILNLVATTNRPDILNIAGFINEIVGLLNINLRKRSLKLPSFDFFKQKNNQIINLTTKNNFFSTIAYIATKIENINYQKTQPWIQRRLLASNIIPKNNLMDLSYYVMLEWGQPIFIYDFDKIKKLTKNENPKITIKFSEPGEIFVDSDSKIHLLTNETLVVVADNFTIGIAGSLISQHVGIDENTKNFYVEAGIFDSNIFRKSQRSIGIRTESSILYERGVNKFLIKPAYNRFLNLLFLFNNNNTLPIINFSIKYFEEVFRQTKIINLSLKNVNQLLGILHFEKSISLKNNVFDFLNRSNFKVFEKEKNYNVLIPFNRFFDISEEIDLIEEIARFIGFNNFYSILPKSYKLGKIKKYEIIKRNLRESFLRLGFLELFNYSITQTDDFSCLKLLNPLSIEFSSLRTSLIPQLLQSLKTNLRQGNEIMPIFEIGHIFKSQEKSYVFENESLSGIFGGSNYKISFFEKNFTFNWFQAKGFLESILINLNVEYVFLKSNVEKKFYHPKNSFSIFSNNQEIGFFGKIHPKIADIYDLPKLCFLFEFDLTKIVKIKMLKKAIFYKPYSLYPTLNIDLSLLIPKSVKFNILSSLIKDCGKDLLGKIEILDFYEKFDFLNDQYSLTIKLYFHSFTKTLLKNEIESIVIEIEKQLDEKLNIKIRK